MYYVLVTGTPGVGKTTLSKLLAEELGAIYCEIGEAARESGALTEKDERRGSHIVDIDNVSRYLAKANRPMIIDGHVILSLPRKKIKRIVVLRCSPTTLALRLKRKKFTIKKIVENILAEVTDVCLMEALHAYGKERIFELDTTEIGVDACVREAAAAIQLGTSRIGICDWLSGLRRKQLQYLEAGQLWPTR